MSVVRPSHNAANGGHPRLPERTKLPNTYIPHLQARTKIPQKVITESIKKFNFSSKVTHTDKEFDIDSLSNDHILSSFRGDK